MEAIKLLGKVINIDECELLLDYDATKEKDFKKYFQVMGGSWRHDGRHLIGTEFENKGGILYTNDEYQFNVMLTVVFSTLPPSTRDLNAVWCSHWDKKANYLGDSYVCGLNGWYDGLSGIEKNGKDSFYTSTSLYKYKKGKFVTLTCGSIDGHCFMTVDGKLITEIIDPKPLTGGYVGISPFCTQLRIKKIQVHKITWQKRNQFYTPEFK